MAEPDPDQALIDSIAALTPEQRADIQLTPDDDAALLVWHDPDRVAGESLHDRLVRLGVIPGPPTDPQS